MNLLTGQAVDRKIDELEKQLVEAKEAGYAYDRLREQFFELKQERDALAEEGHDWLSQFVRVSKERDELQRRLEEAREGFEILVTRNGGHCPLCHRPRPLHVSCKFAALRAGEEGE